MHIHYLRFSLIPYRLLSLLFLFRSLPSSTFLLCVPSARCAHCLSLSLAFSPFPPALRRCISSADESGGSETEYGIAEGGRPIERARGMQSERSRCCHVTERARARPGENAPTHGRQFFRTNVLVRPSSYSSSFPFSSSCSFASCCLSHASYPRLRRVRRLFITRVQTPTSPIFRLFSRMFTRAGKKTSLPFPRCRFYLVSAEF